MFRNNLWVRIPVKVETEHTGEEKVWTFLVSCPQAAMTLTRLRREQWIKEGKAVDVKAALGSITVEQYK